MDVKSYQKHSPTALRAPGHLLPTLHGLRAHRQTSRPRGPSDQGGVSSTTWRPTSIHTPTLACSTSFCDSHRTPQPLLGLHSVFLRSHSAPGAVWVSHAPSSNPRPFSCFYSSIFRPQSPKHRVLSPRRGVRGGEQGERAGHDATEIIKWLSGKQEHLFLCIELLNQARRKNSVKGL